MSTAGAIALKLVLTPVLVGAASLAGRRWGSSVGGWSLLVMPGRATRATTAVEFPAWDLPARMVAATAFVIVLTSIAPMLGMRLAGLIAPFPLYGAVLAGFAHRVQGAGQVVAVLRGLLLGLFAFACLFLALAVLLPAGVAIAFSVAISVAFAVQGGSLLAGRRLGLA